MNRIHELAEILHDNFCQNSHIEGCDWYDNRDWETSDARIKYTKMAKKLLDYNEINWKNISLKTINELLKELTNQNL